MHGFAARSIVIVSKKEPMAPVHSVNAVHTQTPQIAPHAIGVIQASLQKILGHIIVPRAQLESTVICPAEVHIVLTVNQGMCRPTRVRHALNVISEHSRRI